MFLYWLRLPFLAESHCSGFYFGKCLIILTRPLSFCYTFRFQVHILLPNTSAPLITATAPPSWTERGEMSSLALNHRRQVQNIYLLFALTLFFLLFFKFILFYPASSRSVRRSGKNRPVHQRRHCHPPAADRWSHAHLQTQDVSFDAATHEPHKLKTASKKRSFLPSQARWRLLSEVYSFHRGKIILKHRLLLLMWKCCWCYSLFSQVVKVGLIESGQSPTGKSSCFLSL